MFQHGIKNLYRVKLKDKLLKVICIPIRLSHYLQRILNYVICPLFIEVSYNEN
jgi:hypothetical protein